MTTSSSSSTTEILLATILGHGDHLMYNHDFGTLPAFVELFFLDQMEHMIKSSTNHMTSALADMPGSSLVMLLISENFELIFSLISFFVQFYSIEHNDASVIESLYGLQRVHVVQDGVPTPTNNDTDSSSGHYSIRTVIRNLFQSNLTGSRRYESNGGLTPLQRLLSVHALTLLPYVIGELDRFAVYHRQRALARAQELASQRARAIAATAATSSVTASEATSVADVTDSPTTDQPSSSSSSSSPPLGWLGRLSSFSRYLTVQALFLVLQIRRQIHRCTDHSLLLFGQWFPLLKLAYKLLVWGQKVAYMFGYTPYASPVLSILGIALVKQNKDQRRGRDNRGSSIGGDDKRNMDGLQPPQQYTQNNHSNLDTSFNATSGSNTTSFFGNSPASNPSSGPVAPGDGRVRSMEIGAIAVVISFLIIRAAETALRSSREQHRQSNHTHNNNTHNHSRSGTSWWNSLSTRLTSVLTGIHPHNPTLPPPSLSSLPPPTSPRGAKGCVIPPRNASLCPLCRKTRQMSVVTTGGYVFCYPCLVPILRETSTCPITGFPCTELDLIRLYEDDDDS